MSTKVLVSGGAGFIGAAVADHLCSQGVQVLGLDNLNSYYDPKLKLARIKHVSRHKNFSFKTTDIADEKSLSEIYKSFAPDYLIHLAAQAGVRYSMENPKAYADSNLVGFLNILECARHLGTKHLVYASSSSVYGSNTKMPYSVQDVTDHPISLYAATKKANEAMAHSYSHLYGIPTTGLRFFTVYGPWGRPDMAVYSFTNKILKGETISLFNHGNHKRDFTYIDDIVVGINAVMNKPPASSGSAPYRLYNIGNSSPILLSRLISELEEITGRKAITQLKEMQPGDVADTFADISELIKDFNFQPKTDISLGLRKFYDWYKSYN